MAAVHAEVGQPLLYARVDCVAGPTGEPLLGEVEIVDPSLLLRFAASAASRMAEAITALAEQCVRRNRCRPHIRRCGAPRMCQDRRG